MLQPDSLFAEQYKLKRLIDNGGLAEVWEALYINKESENIVALKIFPKQDEAEIKDVEQVFSNQPHVAHSNILQASFFGIYKSQPYLEMRFCNEGNASDKIEQLNENELVKCLHQIVDALAYLHEKSIIHQHIKTKNLLVDNGDYYISLINLGFANKNELAKNFNDENVLDTPKKFLLNTKSTSLAYHAPELFEPNPQTNAATDIWALGAAIFEIATGKLPFGNEGGKAQTDDLATPDLSQSFSADLNSIVKKCLSKKQEDRPTANEIAEWTGNFLRTGEYKIPAKRGASVYPIVFINKPAEQKTNKWKKIILWGLPILIVLTIIILIALNKESLDSSEPPQIRLLQEQPIVTDTNMVLATKPVTDTNYKKVDIKTIDPKILKYADSLQAVGNKLLKQKDSGQTIVSTVPKYKVPRQSNILGTPKFKAPKQGIDPGIPKHKDREQKPQ